MLKIKSLAPASRIEEIQKEIQNAAKNVQMAFPERECRRLAQAGRVDCQNLVSDLAVEVLTYDAATIAQAVKAGAFVEVFCEPAIDADGIDADEEITDEQAV